MMNLQWHYITLKQVTPLNALKPSNLTTGTKIPIFFVVDNAFLAVNTAWNFIVRKTWLARKILFNYRLSRKRRVTENVNGIWIKKFWIFANWAILTRDKASVVVMAILALHNLRLKTRDSNTPKGSVDEIQSNRSLL